MSTVKSNAQEWHIAPPGNNVVLGDYLGANAASTAPLLIQTIPNQPINFATFGTQQMTILGNGNVGIGLAAPTNLLHLHQTGITSSLWEQFTNGNTGATATNGFQVGLNYNLTNNNSDAELRQYERADMNFYTDYNNTSTPRMTIIGLNNMTAWGNNTGYVGIGTTQPLSMLHIGNMNCYNGFYCDDGVTPRAGWRPWMITGTYMCGVPGFASSDQMYVGLKNFGGLGDRDDAVINWGDNIGAHGSADGPDNLRFIFTEYCHDNGNDSIASGMDGLEVMRMMPYIDPVTTNFVSLNTGVGNYFANSPVIPPQRRFEILDGLDDAGAHLNLPQFRLTYRQDATVTLGIHTDFQVMSGGDLFINPHNNNNLRGVGIGTSAPGSELEVFRGNGAGTAFPHLRLTQTSPTSAFAPLNGVFTDFRTENTTGNLKVFPTFAGYASTTVLGVTTYDGIGIVQIGYPGNDAYPYHLNSNLVLDVNGQQNIRTVKQQDTLDHILVWYPNVDGGIPDGRVMWRDAKTLGTQGAENAAWINPANNFVQWGTNPLLHDTKVPMINGVGGLNKEWSIYFEGQSTMANANNPMDIRVGYTMPSPNEDSKFDVLNQTFLSVTPWFINRNAGRFLTQGTYSNITGTDQFTGLLASCVINSTIGGSANFGGDFSASTGSNNTGVRGQAPSTTNAIFNYGVVGYATNAGKGSYGGNFRSGPTAPTAPTAPGLNIGVYAGVLGLGVNNTLKFGVYSDAGGGGGGGGLNYWAGWFTGRVFTTDPGGWSPSDENLKNNIHPLTDDSAIYLIRNLYPKTYVFDTASNPSMSLPHQSQIGLISQQVQSMLPQLVTEAIQPAYSDSLGNMVYDSVKFLAIDYTGFVPILIGAVKQLDSTNQTQQQQNQLLQNHLGDLQQQVDALQNQVQQLLNCCQSNAPQQ